MKNIVMDQGFMFGMGVFETIAVEQEKPLFLDWHLERLKRGLEVLEISNQELEVKVNKQVILGFLNENPMEHGVLKIVVSPENIIITTRENPYTEEAYQKGMSLGKSDVLRNETSRLPYVKSLQYGENILEKRKIKEKGYDEALFCNTKGMVAETTASNLFLVKNRKMFTPHISCGLLDGIVRRYVMEQYSVEEIYLPYEKLQEYDEAFLTNSLMGIMPVNQIGTVTFTQRKVTDAVKKQYLQSISYS